MSMVIVGNGRSVLEHRLGALIDGFRDVVRFNHYVIDGYEEFVGTKTTIWFRNSGRDMPERDTSRFEGVFLQHIEFVNEWTDESVFARFPTVDPETIREIRQHVDAPGLNLSTGIQAVGYLTRRFGHVYIHGFDAFDPPHHYFEPAYGVNHSPQERQYLNHLRSRELVTELKDFR
jgi:hypothetical protein